MKLVLIAIFSVILLVVCEPQQEALADGDTSGLYYNFDKSYGWNFDSRFDESRYDEVDHSQRSDRSRDNKSREQGDPDIKKEDQNHNDRNREKQNDPRESDRYRYRENDKDNNGKNERYNERDKKREEGNDKVDSNRDDKGRSDKNKDYIKEDKNRDKSQDKYSKKGNESDNRNGENQFSQKIDSTQESDKDKNYDRQNQYSKSSRDDQINQRGFDKQAKDRGYKNNNEKDNYESKNKNDKDRKQEKESRNKENDKNEKDINKYENNSKNKNDANNNNKKEKTNESKDDRRSYQEDVNRDDKLDKEYNYDSKYNVQSNKNQNNGNNEYSREPEYKDSSRRDDKNRDSNNNYQYKGEKQSYSRSKSESFSNDNREKSYTNKSPGYGYSYLESLITAPKSNSDSSNVKAMEGPKNKDSRSKEQGKKEEVIEIHGYISKGNEQSDKQVEVDVIVKKADTVLGTGLDTKGGIHIHKVLNNEGNEKGYQIKEPQSELKYEYIKPSKKNENKEKDYRELFNSHVQDKKDLLGGIEFLGLISNIGQEIKEQVIEKIPGYHIIQNLDPRRQKNKSIQEYNYDQNQKNPKIDLEVYYPPKKQDEGSKKVEEKSYTEFDKQDKNKKERVNSKYLHQDGKLINGKEDTYKSTDKNEKHGKYIYTANKDNINKEKQIDIHTKTYGERNQEVKGYQQEGKKDIYDYQISHKQTDRGEMNSQKYVTSHSYDNEKNNEAYQYELNYNSGNSYKKAEKSDITEQTYKNRQNGRYQDPNYFYEPLKVKQDLVNYNRDDDYSSREYLLQDRGISHGPDYQGPGYSKQPDRINPLQDFIRSKQKEEKYIYDYTIGNPEKQGPVHNYNTPYSILPYPDNKSFGQYDKQRDYSNYNDYRPANEYEYNSKHNYDSKPNEGWSYQGFPIPNNDQGKEKLEKKNNFPKYEKDKEDQGEIRNINPYNGYKNYDDFHYREPYYVNKDYPNYLLPNYNQGFGSGFGLAHPYPLPNLMNPLSQQILGSAERVQKYNQNYINMPQQRDYNLHFGESKSIESYPKYDDANNYYEYRKPIYDTAYQSSNKEYMYQYQLPYATATFSLILLVNCEPQRGYPNDEQLTINSNSNRNENRYKNDRRKEGNPRNQERVNEERDQREYRNQGRERSRGNQGSDNVDGRVTERHGAYGGNYGYPSHEGLNYANVAELLSGRDNYRELKKDDRRNKEYKNREYDPYYPKIPNDFYERFPYPAFAGRTGLGFQRRTYLVNGYTSPLSQELLEIVGKRRDFEYDKNQHRVSDYYDLYEPKHEPRYDDSELYYGKKEYKYERQDLYKTPYPEVRPLEYQKGLVNGINNPIGRELLETGGKNYNYNSAYYPNLY